MHSNMRQVNVQGKKMLVAMHDCLDQVVVAQCEAVVVVAVAVGVVAAAAAAAAVVVVVVAAAAAAVGKVEVLQAKAWAGPHMADLNLVKKAVLGAVVVVAVAAFEEEQTAVIVEDSFPAY
jgi:hypothetical protein